MGPLVFLIAVLVAAAVALPLGTKRHDKTPPELPAGAGAPDHDPAPAGLHVEVTR